jgi:hypothetical protein
MPEYETRFCAFVDILGFKSLVRSGRVTPDEIFQILLSVADVTRADISNLMKKMSKFPTNANRVLICRGQAASRSSDQFSGRYMRPANAPPFTASTSPVT